MKQKQQPYKKIQSFAILALLCTMLALPMLSGANASTVAVVNAIPTSDSKVITVIGNGFDPDESVYLALTNATTGVVVYNFTESVTTSSIGAFSKNLTLPPATYGTYSIYAKTSTVSANKEYTIVFVTDPKIAVSPPNSNIFKVGGSGFNPVEVVTFTLIDNQHASAYNFTDYAITDNLGNFTSTLIVPTSICGNYTLVAGTQTRLTANTVITVPDLTGPKGDTGDTGDKGSKGTTGPAGEAADSTLAYVAIIVSVIAAVISIASLLKDREPDEEE
jgi:hypothetical protein